MLMLVLGAGCSRAVRVRSQNTNIPGVMSTWIRSLKAKNGRYDALYYAQNESGRRLMVMTNDVTCARGGQPGRIISRPFNRPDVALVFKPGQRRRFKIRCAGGGRGDVQITLTSVKAADATGQFNSVVARNVSFAVTERGRPAAAPVPAPQPTAPTPAAPTAPVVAAVPPVAPASPAPPTAPTAPAAQAANPPAAQAANPPAAQAANPPAATPATPPPTQSELERRRDATFRELNRVAPQPDWIIAIMEVDDVNAASRSMAIGEDLVRNIGDQLRIFIAERGVRTIDKSATQRALGEVLQNLKQDSYKSCYDDGCQIELGKALAASHILRTKITRFGSRCVLNAELIELRSEVAISAASARGGCGPEGFLGMSEQVASSITGR